MAFLVSPTPPLPVPVSRLDLVTLSNYDSDLYRVLRKYLSEMAYRVNDLLPKDGSEPMTGNLTAPGATFTDGTVSQLIAQPSSPGRQLLIERLNNTINAAVEYKTTAGSVFAGHGTANTFVVGGANNLSLAANQWMTVTSSLLTGPNSIMSIGGTPTLHTRDTNGTGSTATGWIAFEDSTATRMGYIGYGSTGNAHMNINNEAATGAIQLQINGNTQARVENNGVLNLLSGQLQFPATQAPSTDANTLDDYEEGTFTPTVTFATPGTSSFTYIRQNGFYRKIGSVVFFSVDVSFTPTLGTASGAFRVNLPFSAGSTANANLRAGGGEITTLTAQFTWGAGLTHLGLEIPRSQTPAHFQINAMGSATAPATFTPSNLTDGVAHSIRATGWYITEGAA